MAPFIRRPTLNGCGTAPQQLKTGLAELTSANEYGAMRQTLRGSLTTWAPSELHEIAIHDAPTAFNRRDPGELLYVSGWRSAGWVAAHLHRGTAPFGWVRLDGCRTVADCILVVGTALDLTIPGRVVDVAHALGSLNLPDVALDARTVSPDLPAPMLAAISSLAPHTQWWAAIHEPLPVANHVSIPGSAAPPPADPIPATTEAGVWFPGSPRVDINLNPGLQRPDAPVGTVRVDVCASLQMQPRRSLGAIVDSLIGVHSDLFGIATEQHSEPIEPSELFGLRLLAENASDDNVACLAGASAIRWRMRFGQPTEALERAEQVLVRTQRADPAHRALVIWAEAVVQLQTGALHRAEARFADAIALVESSRDKSLLATMNRRWGDRLAARRLYRQASHRYRVALGVYRQRGDTEGAAATTRGSADLAVAAGEQFSADALFDQADMNTTTAHEQINRLIGRIGLAIAGRRWESIERLRERILRIGIPGATDRANLDRREADAALRTGDPITAEARALGALRQYEHAGELAAAADCRRMLGDVAAMQGDMKEAYRHFRQAVDCHARCGDWLGLARTLDHMAALDHSRGYPSDAAVLRDLSRELSIAGGGS